MGVSNSFRVVTNQLSYTMERQTDGRGFGCRLQPDAVDKSKAVTAEVSTGSGVFFMT